MSYVEDRQAIEDVVRRYGTAIDEMNFPVLQALFTDDASVIYGTYPEMIGGATTAAFLKDRTSTTAWHQHLVTVMDVQIDGDHASTVAYFIAHAIGHDDTETVRVNVGDYRDQLTRTETGWRISQRRQFTGWKEARTRTALR